MASAWPLVAFITAPTIAPAAATFPPRIFSATSGCAASASLDRRGQCRVVGHHREAAGGHHLVRFTLAGEHPVDDLPGQLVGQRAVPDQLGDPGDLLRA